MTKPQKLCLWIGVAALCCALGALGLGGLPGALLGWTALSCGLASLAYARNRPDLYGKRAGRLAVPRVLLLLPFLVAFWTGCWLIRQVRHVPDLDHVAPGLYVGGRIRPSRLPPDVRLIVDLTSEYNEPRALRSHPGYRCLPLLDGHVPPDEAACLALLEEMAANPGAVFVHCESGVGRAPTLAALLLIRRGVVPDAASAVERLAKQRPGIHPTRSDFAFLERLTPRLQGLA